MDHKTYDSVVEKERLKLNAPYYNAINPTTITFVQESVTATADALGHIEFFDGAGCSVGAVDLPVDKDPSQYGHTAQYGEMECCADGATITFFLPVYGWDDSYPHCDGESDRWSRYVSRYFRVVFHCEKREIAVLDREN